MLKMKMMVPIALGAISIFASQSEGNQTFTCPAGKTWDFHSISGQNGKGTPLYDENLNWVGVHVDCSGAGECVSISPDHRTLTINGIDSKPDNGYDPNDPQQAQGDIYFGTF